MVLLDSDVAEVFPDSESVNQALRALIPIIRWQASRSNRAAAATNESLQSCPLYFVLLFTTASSEAMV